MQTANRILSNQCTREMEMTARQAMLLEVQTDYLIAGTVMMPPGAVRV